MSRVRIVVAMVVLAATLIPSTVLAQSGDDPYDPASASYSLWVVNSTGNYSGDDHYDSAVRRQARSSALVRHDGNQSSVDFVQWATSNYSGDDTYDSAAWSRYRFAPVVISDTPFWSANYSGDDAYDLAAGGDMRFYGQPAARTTASSVE